MTEGFTDFWKVGVIVIRRSNDSDDAVFGIRAKFLADKHLTVTVVHGDSPADLNAAIRSQACPVVCLIDGDVFQPKLDMTDMCHVAMMDGVGIVTACIGEKTKGETFSLARELNQHVLMFRKDIHAALGGFAEAGTYADALDGFVVKAITSGNSVVKHEFSSYGCVSPKTVFGESMMNALSLQKAGWVKASATARSEMCSVIPFYNYANQATFVNNHLLHVESLRKQGVEFLTVELALEGAEFTLPECGPRIQVRTKSLLWQKEALINLGARSCSHRYISWHDSGTILDADWADKSMAMMKHFDVVQCFSRQLWMEKNGSFHMICDGAMKALRGNTSNFNFGGTWMARRELFDSVGMYHACIVGGGDSLFAALCARGVKGQEERFVGMNRWHLSHYNEWYRKALMLDMNFGYVPGKWRHLWHGNLVKRGYAERHGILRRTNFDPATDIKMAESGVLEWATCKPELHEAVKGYFRSRK